MRDAICSSARPARTPGPGRDWAFVIAGHNHFDPTWRRCFDRPAIYNGVTVRGYADLEELVMKAWLGLAGRGYTMSEGQPPFPLARPAPQCILRPR
jgi:hypothetical protein